MDEYKEPSTALATLSLFDHIFMKGIQAGAVIGTTAVAPVVSILHKRRGGNFDANFYVKLQKALVRSTSWASVLSLLAGAALVGGKEGFDEEKIKDRVYRLHYSESQNRCDTFADVGIGAGVVAALLRGRRNIGALVASASVGAAIGVYAHVATSRAETGKQVESAKKSVQIVADEISR